MIPLDSHILSACVTPDILITFMTFQPFNSFSLTGSVAERLLDLCWEFAGSGWGAGVGWERTVDLGIHYFASHAKYKLNRSKNAHKLPFCTHMLQMCTTGIDTNEYEYNPDRNCSNHLL